MSAFTLEDGLEPTEEVFGKRADERVAHMRRAEDGRSSPMHYGGVSNKTIGVGRLPLCKHSMSRASHSVASAFP